MRLRTVAQLKHAEPFAPADAWETFFTSCIEAATLARKRRAAKAQKDSAPKDAVHQQSTISPDESCTLAEKGTVPP
jgi:hypothetical protein